MVTRIIKKIKFTKDKEYAWIVVFAAFLSHFAHLGFSLGIIGNLTLANQTFFEGFLKKGSLLGTIHTGTIFLSVPVSFIFVKTLGCCCTHILGGIFLITGVGLSALSTDLWHAVVFYGILAGFGVACCLSASLQIIAVYFKKQRCLAFSLAFLGSCVGMSVWPFFSHFLFKFLGYPKTMGVMASVHFLHILTGTFFYKPKLQKDPEPGLFKVKIAEETEEKKLGVDNLGLEMNEDINCHSETTKDITTSTQDTIESSEKKVESCTNQFESSKNLESSTGIPNASQNQSDLTEPSKSIPETREKSIPHIIQVVLGSNLGIDMGTLKTELKSSSKPESRCSNLYYEGSTENLKADLSELLKSWKVWLLLISTLLWGTNFFGFLILLNDFSLHITEDKHDTAMGITILGIASITGCAVVIITSGYKFNRLILYMCGAAVVGATATGTAFIKSRVAYYAMASCWGLVQSVTIAGLLASAGYLCKASQAPLLYGLQLLTNGFGGPLLILVAAGLAEEYKKEFGIMFVGVCGLLSALVIFPLAISSIKLKGKAKPIDN